MTLHGLRARFLQLGLLTWTLAFGAGAAHAADCLKQAQSCLSGAKTPTLEFGIADLFRAHNILEQRQRRAANFTISSRGTLDATSAYVFESMPRKEAPKASVPTGSALIFQKGSDGDIGNFALAVGNAGQVSVDMDVFESYLKIEYKLDF